MKPLHILALCLCLTCAAAEVTRPPASASKATWVTYANYLETVVAAKNTELAAAKLDTSRLADILAHVLVIEKLVTVAPVPAPVPVPVPPVVTPPPTTQPPTPPVIVPASPDDARTGTTVIFEASADGSPLSWQWKKNGVPIAAWTSATLTLESVTTNDTAEYTAVATNELGTAESAPVKLNVLP